MTLDLITARLIAARLAGNIDLLGTNLINGSRFPGGTPISVALIQALIDDASWFRIYLFDATTGNYVDVRAVANDITIAGSPTRGVDGLLPTEPASNKAVQMAVFADKLSSAYNATTDDGIWDGDGTLLYVHAQTSDLNNFAYSNQVAGAAGWARNYRIGGSPLTKAQEWFRRSVSGGAGQVIGQEDAILTDGTACMCGVTYDNTTPTNIELYLNNAIDADQFRTNTTSNILYSTGPMFFYGRADQTGIGILDVVAYRNQTTDLTEWQSLYALTGL